MHIAERSHAVTGSIGGARRGRSNCGSTSGAGAKCVLRMPRLYEHAGQSRRGLNGSREGGGAPCPMSRNARAMFCLRFRFPRNPYERARTNPFGGTFIRKRSRNFCASSVHNVSSFPLPRHRNVT
jgi:hypothetical protein